MEQSLLQKLQRVKIKDVWNIVLFLLAWPIAFFYRRVRKDLWLICDNENEARDNGYWLFRYITQVHPERDVMYAINKKSKDYERVKDLGKVVQYGSFLHWVYYLTASKNISSQKEGKPNAAVCYVLEVYGILKNTRVFLQHGVTKDDMPFLYYRNTKMRLFICAVDREYEFIKEHFGYPPGYVVKTGFCRYDNLVDHAKEKPGKRILVMPTWRNWIATPTTKSYTYEDISDFRNTGYYKAWESFLTSEALEEILREHNAELIFYPHRGMQKFADSFEGMVKGSRLATWPEYDVQELLKECDVLITDYSSIAFDFAYMKKPLFYYQFDYEMFRRGQYREGYFDYDRDGFGKVCTGQQELLQEIRNIFADGCRMSKEYVGRVDAFFSFHDRENCRRNYDAICELR